jgi:hypothetical protein
VIRDTDVVDVVVIGSGAFGAAIFRSSDLMTRLASRAVEWFLRFSADTRQPLDVVQAGSLKAARRPEDAAILATEALRGERLGLGTRFLTPEEDAAGAWARQVAARAGIHVPMVPT